MYLHVPDPRVPLPESAAAIAELIRRGQVRYAGVSNVNLEQLRLFHQACPVSVVQIPFNMLQQSAVARVAQYCQECNIAVACYWVLMKGLLAGKLGRDHQFDPRDKRLTYPIYQGEAWQRSQDLLEQLRGMAAEIGCTVAQLVVAWTIHQPAITVALCGAKRPGQIEETTAALQVQLDPASLQRMDAWLADFQIEL